MVQFSKNPKSFALLIAKSAVKQFSIWVFLTHFGEIVDSKSTKSHFFQKRVHHTKFQVKIPIFSQSDSGATYWQKDSKQILTCGQLRNAHRYQKYVRIMRAFFRVSDMLVT